ncbi:MAG: protein translocase subunit SecD [Gammaproteobacteria bacterium]|nr:protein translocase subunit SecD [Gammaproteobacteria bacterium]
MLNHYPLWKYLLILAVALIGLLFALPNLYGEDPALQVSGGRGAPMDETVRERVVSMVTAAGLEPTEVTLEEARLQLRFRNADEQLAAQAAVEAGLGNDYVVALNLAPSAPEWLTSMGALPMYLGLDLRGGVHFLMEVDMEAAVTQAEERFVGDLRTLMRKDKVRYKTVTLQEEGGILVRFRKEDERDVAATLIGREMDDLVVTEDEEGAEFNLRLALSETATRELKRFALQQNITTLRNRVNELGVAEPVIQQQGLERIVVQLPGVQDPARAKDILGATATLEFRAVDMEGNVQDALDGRVPVGSKLYRHRDGSPILLEKRVILTGDHITFAKSGIDSRDGSPMVNIRLDGRGGRIMNDFTKNNIGNLMAVVFIENKVTTRMRDGEPVKIKQTIEEVINAARIREQFAANFQITGLDSTEEARDLSLLLRAGALAAPIEIIEERTVGPSLGQENIEQGFRSVMVGFVLVLVFMAVYYRVFGLVANLALAMNLVLIVAVLSMLQATLTLPGIAGIVLTVGMAVDANVLIFQRIREEIHNGNTPQAAIHSGYQKAVSTIADANITTLIAAVVLFGFGTGPIKGFAITLSIGIITSMFTAIMGTRAVINLIYGGRRVARLSI